jgi:hypothetical protein
MNFIRAIGKSQSSDPSKHFGKDKIITHSASTMTLEENQLDFIIVQNNSIVFNSDYAVCNILR